MSDRLEEIEQHISKNADMGHIFMTQSKVEWLIAEVKRLRELVDIQKELLNLYASGAKP